MNPKTKRVLLLSARAVIAITLLGALIWNIRAGEIFDSLARIALSFLLSSILSLYASILLGSFNQYVLFQPILKLPFNKFILSYFKAFVTGIFFPGQIGDASIIYFLKPSGLYYSQSFSIYLWDKFITFIIYAGILFLFLSRLKGYHDFFIPLSLILLLVFSAGFLYLFSTLKYFQSLGGWMGRARLFMKNSASEILKYAGTYPVRLLINFNITCIKIFLVMSCYYFMFSAFGYRLSFWNIGISSIASGFVAYLPISIQGIGTVEATAVWIFGRLKIGPADVLSGFLLLRICGYLFAIVAFCLTCLMEYKKDLIARS